MRQEPSYSTVLTAIAFVQAYESARDAFGKNAALNGYNVRLARQRYAIARYHDIISRTLQAVNATSAALASDSLSAIIARPH